MAYFHFHMLVIFQTLLLLWHSAASGATSRNHWNLQNWNKARCGPTGQAIWLYQGKLYDLTSGDAIACVEGLEVVQSLGHASSSVSSSSSTSSSSPTLKGVSSSSSSSSSSHDDDDDDEHGALASWTDLRMGRALQKVERSSFNTNDGDDDNTPPSWEATSWLSSKVFLYRHVNKPQQLLRTIKLRPGGPSKSIPMDQAAVVYETANTLVESSTTSSRSTTTSALSTSNEGPSSSSPSSKSSSALWIHAEWPNGRSVWNRASVLPEDGDHHQHQSADGSVDVNLLVDEREKTKTTQRRQRQRQSRRDKSLSKASRTVMEFSVHARPRAAGRKRAPDLVHEFAAARHQEDDDNDAASDDAGTATTRSPQRSALISFGASSAEGGSSSSTGARETYQYQMESDGACTVRYTRTGEGPAWYGPHRLCTLELRGKRLDDIPALATVAVGKKKKDSGNDNDTNDDMLQSLAMRLGFRRPLRLDSSGRGSDKARSSRGGREKGMHNNQVKQDVHELLASFRSGRNVQEASQWLGITASDDEGSERAKPSGWRGVKSRAVAAANRLRRATTLELQQARDA